MVVDDFYPRFQTKTTNYILKKKCRAVTLTLQRMESKRWGGGNYLLKKKSFKPAPITYNTGISNCRRVLCPGFSEPASVIILKCYHPNIGKWELLVRRLNRGNDHPTMTVTITLRRLSVVSYGIRSSLKVVAIKAGSSDNCWPTQL